MAIEITLSNDDAVIRQLNALAPSKIYKVISAASKRAATAARTAGTKKLREVYTMKASGMKSRSSIRPETDGAVLEIKGPPEVIKKFAATEKKYGIFATIKRGHGIRIPRSFSVNDRFVSRVGSERYPLKGLYGPSVPQMFGHPAILEAMTKRGCEVFESRLMHEIGRKLGGY